MPFSRKTRANTETIELLPEKSRKINPDVIDTEAPLSEFQQVDEDPEFFMYSEQAAAVLENPKFLALYESFEKMAEEAEEKGEIGSDLTSENDDSGPIEYKYLMCKLTTLKIYKRMTQMKWRLEVSGQILFQTLTCILFVVRQGYSIL